MTNQEWAKLNQTAGRKYQIHYPYIEWMIFWLDWDGVIKISPNAIRSDSWPEPDGWFFGWNRDQSSTYIKYSPHIN